ncbi:hypothetical protein ACFE04_028271 [Oxalis oulophora]
MITTGLILNELALSRLIAFCALSQSRNLNYCTRVLLNSPNSNGFSWNVTIRGFLESGSYKETIFMYKQMLLSNGCRPDKYTYPLLFKVCAVLELELLGYEILGHVVKLGFDNDSYVVNSLIYMLVSCGNLGVAREVFDESSVRDLVTWNSLINGYVRWGRELEAVRVYEEMAAEGVEPDEVTMIGVVSSCAQLGDLKRGRGFHRCIEEKGINVTVSLANTLMDMYSKCGDIKAAREIFDSVSNKTIVSWTTMVAGYAKCGLLDIARDLFEDMPEKDVVPWNAIIGGCVQAKRSKEALALFHEMQASNVNPDEVTMIHCLSACAQLGALDIGIWIHRYIEKQNLSLNVALGTSLVDMYAKCGNIPRALQIFHEMPRRNSLTWTSIIGGLALHGNANDALTYFSDMINSGLMPDEVTFLGVLSACCHGGLVDDGRAGHLEEAEELIKSMRMEADAVVWGALFFACRTHGNLEMGKRVAAKLLELDPHDSGIYVLLGSMYGEAGMWEEARSVRRMMNARGVEKTPGCSSIEVNGVVAEFIVRDKSHKQSPQIYECLAQLMRQARITSCVSGAPNFWDDSSLGIEVAT